MTDARNQTQRTAPTEVVRTSQELGETIRKARKNAGLNQTEAAALCNVGLRFISELENGKPTAELGKILQVINGLGLQLTLKLRTQS